MTFFVKGVHQQLIFFSELATPVYGVIIYMKKFQNADWLREGQSIPNSAESYVKNMLNNANKIYALQNRSIPIY